MSASNLSKFLVNPSRVASIFDWKKARSSIMCLDIRKHSIGVAIARHPQCHDNSDFLTTSASPSPSPSEDYTYYKHNRDFDFDHSYDHDSQTQHSQNAPTPTLHRFDIAFPQRPHNRSINSLSSSKKDQICISNSTKQIHETLESIVNEHQVCAFVVHWPLSAHGRRIGEKCGTVLHKLDQLVSFPSSVLNSTNATSSSATSAGTGRTSTTSSSHRHRSVASSSSKSYHTANTNISPRTASASAILNENRPFTLIVPENHMNCNGQQQQMVVDEEDVWGRNSNLSYVQSNPRPVQFSSKKGVTLLAFDNEQCLQPPVLAPITGGEGGEEDEPSAVAARILNQFLSDHWSEDIIKPERTAFDNTCTLHRRIDFDNPTQTVEMMNTLA